MCPRPIMAPRLALDSATVTSQPPESDMAADRIALVTGAASGIGRAIARRYATEGFGVIVSDVDETAGRETVRAIEEAGGDARFLAADVSDPEACRRLVDGTITAFGRLDVACNNAGIGGEQLPTAEYSIEGWRRVLEINLSGVFYCMKYEIPAMRAAGGGAIVNMASILGQVGFATAPAYVAAKHGVVGLTKTTALEIASEGIRVNAVGPAFIETPMIGALRDDPATFAEMVGLHPVGRLGTVEEVAALVSWLSSSEASFVTGAYYPVDGGYLAR